MESNQHAYDLIKKAQSNNAIATIFGGDGGFLVGWPLGSLTWAMYEYSVCSGKLGKLVEMLEDMPVDGGLPVEKEGTNKNSDEE